MREKLAKKIQTNSGGWMLKLYYFVKGNDSEMILIYLTSTHAKWMI